MKLRAALRSVVPTSLRARVRGSRVGEAVLRAVVRREQAKPHPQAPYTLHFDGHRNLGWALGGLAKFESKYIAFTTQILSRLRPNAVWDVGANIGFWSLYFAGFKPTITTIVAYEPDRTNIRLLRKNVEANGLSQVEVREFALSDRGGTATFHADAVTGSTGSLESGHDFINEHYGRETKEVDVRLTTADAELAAGVAAPQFVKIDVEGHELSLLQGAAKLLADVRPCMLLEVSGDSADDTFALLRAANYRIFDAANGQELREPSFEIAALPAEAADELLK